MLEILALFYLCKKIGKIIRAKDRKPFGYQLVTIFFWIVGEVGGVLFGNLMLMQQRFSHALLLYLCSLIGGAGGGFIGWWFAKIVEPWPIQSLQIEPSRPITCSSCGEVFQQPVELCAMCGNLLEQTTETIEL